MPELLAMLVTELQEGFKVFLMQDVSKTTISLFVTNINRSLFVVCCLYLLNILFIVHHLSTAPSFFHS